MKEKNNPNYESSAVMLTNPPPVIGDLHAIRSLNLQIMELKAKIDSSIPQELKDNLTLLQSQFEIANKEIRKDIDTYGSYQYPEKGEYALKQRRESIDLKPELVRKTLEPKLANLIIIEAVNALSFEGLVKGKLITAEEARACGEIKESFAYIIR